MAVIFDKLWNSHPTIEGDEMPCSTNGKSNFSNQCAIRVGVSLNANGMATRDLRGVAHCWHHPKSAGHVLRAEELAKALDGAGISWLGARETVDPDKIASVLGGRSGILFLKDYWRRGGEDSEGRTGDHIDLWNGTRMTDWTTWFRVQWGLHWEGVWSDYGEARETWFWPVP